MTSAPPPLRPLAPVLRPIPLAVAALYAGFLVRYGVGYLGLDFLDFPSFAHAARAAFRHGASPYDPAFLERAADEARRYVFPFLHPPPSLLLFSPLAFLPYRAAAVLALAASHAALALSAWLLLRRLLPPLPDRFAWLAFAYLLLSHPVVLTLNRGQVNLVALLLLCVAWRLQRRGAAAPLVALPVAGAVLLKLYPLLLVPWLVLRRRADAAAWTLGLLVAAAGIAVPLLPPAVWGEWLTRVAPGGGYGASPAGLFSPAAPYNQSLNGFVARLLLPNEFAPPLLAAPAAARGIAYGLAGVVLAVTFGASWRSRRRAAGPETGRVSLDLELPLLLAAITLVAPFSWEHHLVFLLPAVLVLLREAMRPGTGRVEGWVVVGAAAVLAWRLPVWSRVFAEGWLTLLISAKLYAACAVWALLARRAYRAGSLRSDEGPDEERRE